VDEVKSTRQQDRRAASLAYQVDQDQQIEQADGDKSSIDQRPTIITRLLRQQSINVGIRAITKELARATRGPAAFQEENDYPA